MLIPCGAIGAFQKIDEADFIRKNWMSQSLNLLP